MKTFETEKHNIPEGATHYFNEDHFNYFTWVAVDSFGNCWGLIEKSEVTGGIKPIPQTNTETPEEKEALDLIDTTPHQYESVASKEVEWDGEGLPPVGAICNWRMASGEVEICGRYGNMTWIFDIEMGAHISVKDASGFTKPETPQQREERERDELILKMIDDFTERDLDCNYRGKVAKVCAALYDAGYRKES